MYGLIRLFIGCIVLCCMTLRIKKSNKTHKNRIFVSAIIISSVFTTILGFIPFENLFITFSSPEKVFHYYRGSRPKNSLIVTGKNSDLVINEDDGTYTYLLVPKVAAGWKIRTGINNRCISHKIYNGMIIDVYQYKNKNDYFVSILDMNGGYSQITDSFQSEFTSLEQSIEVLEKTYVTYCTNIQDFTDEYWINVNGEKIIVNDQ